MGFNKTKPIEVVTTEKDRAVLALDLPSPLKISAVEWILITPENADTVWENLRKDNKHAVLFAITSDGYEELSYGMSEIRNYIATQRMIILKYQEYYESSP